MDRLPKVLGVIRTSERTCKAARCEGQSQHLAIELGHLGIRFHERPGAALDLGQCLQDIRPCAAQSLHITTASGPRRLSGGLRG